METLFDLIFSNLWILVIAFGVISSLFGGDKKKKQQHRPVLDLPTMRREEQHETPKEMRTMELEAEFPSASETSSTAQAEPSILTEQLRQRQEMWAKQAAASKAKADAILAGKAPITEKKQELQTYSKNKLVNGIIMAEILGPPRAKRPMMKRK